MRNDPPPEFAFVFHFCTALLLRRGGPLVTQALAPCPTWQPLCCSAILLAYLSQMVGMFSPGSLMATIHTVITKIVVARWLAESKGEFCETTGATKRTGAGVTILGHAGMISYGVASPKSGSVVRSRARGPVLYRRKGKSVTFSLLLHSPSGCPSVSLTDDCGGNIEGVIDQPEEALVQCWKAVFRDATSSAPLTHLYRVSFCSVPAPRFLSIRAPVGPLVRWDIVPKPQGYTVSQLVPHAYRTERASFVWADKVWFDRSRRTARNPALRFANDVKTVIALLPSLCALH